MRRKPKSEPFPTLDLATLVTIIPDMPDMVFPWERAMEEMFGALEKTISELTTLN
jgi:hypothetical protein